LTVSVILTCAGNGCRFGHNKLMKSLGGKPVFIRTVEQFYRARGIDEIIIAVRKDEIKKYQKWLNKEKLPAKLVIGGEQRYISAHHGVKQSKGKNIIVHDGDRPLISIKLIEKLVKEVEKFPAVIPAVASHTSIKKIKGSFVNECLPRAETWLAQTPQAFNKNILLKAYKKAIREKEAVSTDDCELVSRLGVKIKMIEGEHENIKITIPSDLIIVRQLYKIMFQKKHA
jgi:2-C-methyl-D-erythritol 4-phosphate cytidylyltransferase